MGGKKNGYNDLEARGRHKITPHYYKAFLLVNKASAKLLDDIEFTGSLLRMFLNISDLKEICYDVEQQIAERHIPEKQNIMFYDGGSDHAFALFHEFGPNFVTTGFAKWLKRLLIQR